MTDHQIPPFALNLPTLLSDHHNYDAMQVSDALLNAFETSWTQFRLVCLIYCIGLSLEGLRPAQVFQSIQDISFNIAYTALFILLTNLLLPPIQALTQLWITTWSLGVPITLPDTFTGQLIQALAFLFIYDFFYYWFHRLQHKSSLLWAVHKVHHSEISLNITTSTRHHWLEEPIRAFFVLLPMGILFNQKPITIAWLWTGLSLWGYFIHMNLRVHLGALSSVLCGPQVHRIHHSNMAIHRDRNFAAFFPFLDIIFQTYYSPKCHEYPSTGLADGENLNGLLCASLAPFQTWKRAIFTRRKTSVS